MKSKSYKVLSVILVTILFSSLALPGVVHAIPAPQAEQHPQSAALFVPAEREMDSSLASTAIGNWSALGSNLAGTDGALSHPSYPTVFDIAVHGTDVYVGGCFVNAGGDPTADYVAKWDTLTGTWSGLGNDGAATPDGALKGCVALGALAIDGTNVYVGGGPNTWIGGAPAPQAKYLAKWDGTSWSGLGDDGAGGSSLNSAVNTIAIDGNEVYVGGYFTDVKNGTTTLTEADYIARWDTLTGNWSALGNNGMGNGALSGGVETILVMNSDVYVGGRFIDVFNGLNEIPEAIYLAKWDGTQWAAVGSSGENAWGGSLNSYVYALASDGANLYVAGSFENVNNNGTILTAADHVAKWDGTNWSALGSNGSGDGALNEAPIAILTDGTDVYVGGGFTDVNNNGTVLTAADYVAKWDSENWSALGSNGNGNGSLNTYVYSSLGLVGNKLYVGGEFTNVNNNGTVLNTADYIAAYEIGDGIYRVSPNGISTSPCGHNWTNPCDFQYALNSLASAGDELWVKAGIYKPTTGTNRESTFILKDGVAVYGGFAGTEMLREQRDPSANITVLSGDLNGDDNSNIAYDEPTRAENVFHVVSGSGAATAILDGFTITGGNANGYDYYSDHTGRGGGMWNGYGSPTLANIIFTGNSAQRGGGMYVVNSNPTLTDVTFSGNTAAFGGGMSNDQNANPHISRSTFYDNHAVSSGVNTGQGGGIFNSYSNPLIENTTFYGNTAQEGGSGVADLQSDPTLVNVTFTGNWDAIRNTASHPILRNSIIWGNIYPGNGGVYTIGDDANSSTTASDSVIQNGFPGGTNIITTDPLLGTLGNYGGNTQTIPLSPGSSAIDAGNDSYCPATDQRGVTRPQGSHCDIGAYEYTGILSPGETVRVSVDSGGIQSNGYSSSPAVSADWRYVAFASYASNLVPGDTNERNDIYVHDLQTGITTRVSVNSNGVQADGDSYNPSISADGRFIAFASFAANLVPGGINGRYYIYVHDMQTGSTTRVSVDSSGAPLDRDSNYPSISGDGRYVAFETYGGNILIHDTQTGITTIASVDSSGVEANRESYHPSVSGDGRYVAFSSPATNLVPGDNNGTQDIFVHDMQTGLTTRVSVDSDGVEADGPSGEPVISADGRYVAFQSFASNLVIADTNWRPDIFVYDMQTGMTTRVSIDSNGAEANDRSSSSAISSDGRYVAFVSVATNLVPDDTNGATDVFVHDTQTGTTTRVSVDSSGAQANNIWSPWEASISADGQYIAFDSDATNLVPGDTNLYQDVFVHRQNISATPPTPTPTYTPTFTPTFTPTYTPTSTPTETPTPTFTPTFTPTSTPTDTPTPTNTFTPTVTPPYSYYPLYLSFTSSQTIGGISSSDEDIWKFDGSTWSLFFDGSDVGVGSPDLFAFSVVDSDTILMAFSSAVMVNGVSGAPQDVLRFEATSLGANTAGTFYMYFDGSDVGFDTSSESIDSLTLLPDGRLLFSTTSSPAVPGVSGKDEDVLAFTPTSLGDATAGTWSMYFDGSDVGLADTSSEDVDALDVTTNGNIYLSTTGDFAVPGVAGADEDVFICAPTSIGDVTACNYSSTLYFDGSTWNLGANDVDAFNFLTLGPVSTSTPSNTPTITATPTNTRTPTSTATPTRTASPTATFTRTPTRTSTPTRTPTASSTPTSPAGVFDVQILSHTPNPSSPGEVVTVVVSVTDVGGGPAGTVTVNIVSDEGSTWCTTTDTSSTCSGQLKFNNAGGHLIRASVGGDFAEVDHSVTPSATNTPTATATSSQTATFTPGNTPTNTNTPGPTFTPTITFTPSPTSDVSDLIFADGFESGDFSAWTNTVTGGDGLAVVQTSTVHTGSFAAQLSETANTGSVAYSRKSLPAAETDLTVSGDFLVTQEGASGGNVPIFRLFDASGTRLLAVYRQNATNGQIWSYDSTTRIQASSLMPLNTWVHFEVHVITNGTGVSTIEVYMDGVRVIQTSTAGLGTAGVLTIQIGNNTAQQTFTLYADDIRIQR